MSFCCLNYRIITAYGVGNGNVPALLTRSVGHLWVVLFKVLNPCYYEQIHGTHGSIGTR